MNLTFLHQKLLIFGEKIPAPLDVTLSEGNGEHIYVKKKCFYQEKIVSSIMSKTAVKQGHVLKIKTHDTAQPTLPVLTVYMQHATQKIKILSNQT